MIGIPLGLLYQNMGEWLVHKYILHGKGKKKGNFFNFHFYEHHRAARVDDMVDGDYRRPIFRFAAAAPSVPTSGDPSAPEGTAGAGLPGTTPRSSAVAGASGWNAQTKEAVALALTTVAHWPLFPIAPFFVMSFTYGSVRYYRVHKKAHLDTAWAKEHLPWHYDHHMGPNQDANWCVSKPWFDDFMGTRIPYVGTEREKQDIARRAKLARSRAEKKAREQDDELRMAAK